MTIFSDSLVQRLPPAKRRRFWSGVEAFSHREFISLNAAGRNLLANPATGLSRVWLNIDHTSLGDFTVGVIAIQTGWGWAVPIWFQINLGRRNAAISPLMEALERLAQQLRANPRLQPVLVGGFVLRTKTDKIGEHPSKREPHRQHRHL